MRRLAKSQEEAIKSVLIDKHPELLSLPYALWTRQAVAELIQKQFGITLPIRTAEDYLKR